MMYSNFKIIYAFVFFIFCSINLSAQNSSVDSDSLIIYQKVQQGTVMIRWKPPNAELWKKGLKDGYMLEKYLVTGVDSPKLVYKTERPILPKTFDHWGVDEEDEQVELLRDLIHFEKKEEAWQNEHYPAEFYTEEKRERSRFLFSNFIQNADFERSVQAGLGFLDEEVKAGEIYIYKIYLASDPSVTNFTIDIEIGEKVKEVLPELVCDFGSESVDFSWNTKKHLRDYYGYQLSMSEDGINYQSLSETPFFNLYDHLDTSAVFENFYHKVKLPEKDKTYWFRLQGADYFGGMSENFSVCSGDGYEPVNFSPAIIKTIQTDSNYAFIKWKLEAEYEHLVAEFQVFRSDEMDGIYRPVMTGIDNKERSVSIKMIDMANYYRIVAVPHRGSKVSSFPALVMGRDETPPATPAGVTASIDSMGIVSFSWQKNTEDDLDGYIIFKSYVKDGDFARITSKPLKETQFIDTVNMQSGNELVYYKLQAVDKVNNRSAFTDILEVKKIDKFPPVEPHIHSVKNYPDRIELKWHKSGSKDVVLHRLFRKPAASKADWTLLAEYGLINPVSSFIDKDIETGIAYAYTLVAVDDDGLESIPAQVAIGKPVDHKLNAVIEQVEVEFIPESSKVAIKWNYNEKSTCTLDIYRSVNGGQPAILTSVPAEQLSFEDTQVKKGKTYAYFLRAACNDGTRSPFSEKKVIALDY